MVVMMALLLCCRRYIKPPWGPDSGLYISQDVINLKLLLDTSDIIFVLYILLFLP